MVKVDESTMTTGVPDIILEISGYEVARDPTLTEELLELPAVQLRKRASLAE